MIRNSSPAVAGILTVALLLFGCAEGPADRRHERTILAFGTIIDVEVLGEAARAQRALDAVDAYFQTLHVDWYAFGQGELGRANERLAQGQSAEVSPELAALLRRSLTLRQASQGAFDPTIGDLVKLWGFADQEASRKYPPSEADIKAWLGNAGYRDKIRVRDGQVITEGPVTLDLSAVAKGAALEGAAKLLLEHGIKNAVVDAGGDIKVLGSRPERPWRIGIRHPRANTSLATVTMRAGEAIVSSGDYQRFFDYREQRFHHVIDPRSGMPIQHTIAVTVIADDAALADAAATALMVAGPVRFHELTESLGVDAALLISSDGDIIMTSAMSRRLSPPAGPASWTGEFQPHL